MVLHLQPSEAGHLPFDQFDQAIALIDAELAKTGGSAP